MKKRFIALLAIVPVLFILFIFARITGAIQFFRLTTPSCEPALKNGALVFSSNLKKPKNGDLIAYKSDFTDLENHYSTKGEIHFHRVIASAGDVIEMKDGVCFVNEQNVDSGKNLMQNYTAASSAIKDLPENIANENRYSTLGSMNQFEVFLTTKEADKLIKEGIKLEKVIYKKGSDIYTGAFSWLKKEKEWTIDNFGPLKVPPDCFFILGDNRHNALDSRYVGFIKKIDFVGTRL